MTEKSYAVSIYKSGDDCTNGGVTSKAKRALLFRTEADAAAYLENPEHDGWAVVLVLDAGPATFAHFIATVRDIVATRAHDGQELLATALADFNHPTRGRIRAVPFGEKRWTMMGGNFIWTSDSRFRQEVSEYPIPVHDRCEG